MGTAFDKLAKPENPVCPVVLAPNAEGMGLPNPVWPKAEPELTPGADGRPNADGVVGAEVCPNPVRPKAEVGAEV